VHLNGAHQLLVQIWDKKKRASKKTKTLHRIYCYLRIIWESTQLSEDGYADFASRPSTYGSVFKMFEQTDLADPAYNTLLGQQDKTSAMPSYEYIYGIPQDLLEMLEDTIKLIHRLDRARKGIESFEDLDSDCNQLEQRILDWTVTVPQGSRSPVTEGAQKEVFQHQSTSFHSALIIYFSQNIRSLDRRYLKQYVEDVLKSIETIESIKAETNMLAAPLFWPAFIAATTAYTSEHQARFRKWYEEASSYGIATIRTGICVILEVWAKGPTVIDPRQCPWRHVVSRRVENLMLS
jgi:arginine metabolism regulation protein II